MVNEAILVTVLRHGEVAGRAHVFRGASDEPLSERGLTQMRAAVAGKMFDSVATSPLVRCRAFAEQLASERGLPLTVLPALREMHFGAWEGLSPEEASAHDPEVFERFMVRGDAAAAPSGETLGAFRERVVAGWEAWLADDAGRQRLLVSHAGVMRMLLQHLLGLPPANLYRLALPEAAQFQVSCLAGHAPVLLNLNRLSADDADARR